MKRAFCFLLGLILFLHGIPSFADGYSASMYADRSRVSVGEMIVASIRVSFRYNAYSYRLLYDSDKLSYCKSPGNVEMKNEGELIISGFGKNREEPLNITFKAKTEGNAEIKLCDAYIDAAENVTTRNTPRANIDNASLWIEIISKQKVTDDLYSEPANNDDYHEDNPKTGKEGKPIFLISIFCIYLILFNTQKRTACSEKCMSNIIS